MGVSGGLGMGLMLRVWTLGRNIGDGIWFIHWLAVAGSLLFSVQMSVLLSKSSFSTASMTPVIPWRLLQLLTKQHLSLKNKGVEESKEAMNGVTMVSSSRSQDES